MSERNNADSRERVPPPSGEIGWGLPRRTACASRNGSTLPPPPRLPRRGRGRITAILGALLLGVGTVDARGDAPAGAPDVKTLVEKSIESAGGREKIAAVKSMEVAGTVNTPAMGIDGTFSMKKKSDRALMKVDLANLGTIRVGWNGGVVYEQSDLTGTRLVTGTERDQLLRDLDFKQQFTRLELLKDVRVDGAETVNGRQTWRVVGTSEAGADETHWIDQKNHQLVRLAMNVDTQMGRLKTTIEFKDYKTIEGLPIPMTTEQEAAGTKMVMKITEVKLNPELPDAQFELPAEVKQLVAKQAAAPATTRPGNP